MCRASRGEFHRCRIRPTDSTRFQYKVSCIPGSNSNHSVVSVGSFAQRNGHQGGSHVGSLGRKYSTPENHYHHSDFPNSLRKNIAYCGNGNSPALQRLLGQESFAESDCTDQTGQYSCADVSNVLTPLTAENLRRIRTPADYRKFPEDDVATTTSGSYVVDADDLCNESRNCSSKIFDRQNSNSPNKKMTDLFVNSRPFQVRDFIISITQGLQKFKTFEMNF